MSASTPSANIPSVQSEVAPTPTIHFRGQHFEPMPSGALFWPATQTLLVADLHLEKMSSFAAKGQLLPPYDTGMTLRRLADDLTLTNPRRVIALGDSFHRDEGTASLQPNDLARVQQLTAQAEFIWLSGNHDPSTHALGGTCSAHHEEAGIVFAHEPDKTTPGLMAGHLHPAARVVINARSTRHRCFVHDERLMILPAYGSSTGNLNIMSQAFDGLLHWPQLQVTMLGRDRVYSVSPKRLVAG